MKAIFLLILFSTSCTFTIEEGFFKCDISKPDSCPTGYSCLERGTTGETRCYSKGTGYCQDGELNTDQGEECDGLKFPESFSCNQGERMLCTSHCEAYCAVCGNGFMETEISNGISIGESCDGTDFQGKDCSSFGAGEGELLCNDHCQMNFTQCQVNVVTNHKPEITNLPYELSVLWHEPGSYTLYAQDEDEDDSLQWSLYSTTCSFDIDVNYTTGDVSFTCNSSEECGASVMVSDDGTPSLSDIGTLTILCVNSKPSIDTIPDPLAIENNQYTYNISCSDPENNQVHLLLAPGDTCNGSLTDFSNGTGLYSFTPDESMGGKSCIIAIECSDSDTSDLQSSKILIYESNSPPEITNLPNTKYGHASSPNYFSPIVTDSDIPASTFNYAIIHNTCSFTPTINIDTGAMNWICNDIEVCDIEISVTDKGVPPLSTTGHLTVYCNNTPPQITTIPTSSATEDELFMSKFSCSDIEGDDLFFEIGPDNTCPGAILVTVDSTTVYYEFTWNELSHDSSCIMDLICSDNWDSTNTLITNNVNVKPWLKISSGYSHSCGIRAPGEMYCWGLNSYGNLGSGNLTNFEYPQIITSAFEDWILVSTGKDFSCGIRANTSAYCWGLNSMGQLGTGNITDSNIPLELNGSSWIKISSGGWHSCGIRSPGEVYCWGINSSGELGLGYSSTYES